jgi:hypothetical protein
LEAFYRRFDDDFPQAAITEDAFNAVIDVVGGFLENERVWQAFRRKALFFTLFGCVYDAMHGLPGYNHGRIRFTGSVLTAIRNELDVLAEKLAYDQPPHEFGPFREAARSSTTDPARRRLRHEFLWQEAFAKFA